MNYKLNISSIAEDNIDAAAEWYSLQANNIGDKFIIAVQETFNKILENPLAYPCVYGKYRRALVRHFPYIVYFILDNNIVRISTLFHTSRSPETIYKQLH